MTAPPDPIPFEPEPPAPTNGYINDRHCSGLCGGRYTPCRLCYHLSVPADLHDDAEALSEAMEGLASARKNASKAPPSD